ncbi:MAG: hypothetical protein A2087_05105 [Spirochaetes bacterium GWD1_61_31]|nr:MAG: hypothetical protein A2Y37_14575 [Spirochaetes bacterium GWB1_60_80]OHD32576.1 MAG: hypothetical protein A2004_06135 [Spirochaetes bacterium GWC1_61_12]OHD34805.1 MAG: hypothetical protein A2087_05105 [Spirochaetes bacterium GWD1_61_31]OHD44570.1 MAG: hypothetical protein A2Y35_05415 [Spirochaetes bacterium GWE1_60_18]OHD58641.1 MAG: hypothetical protein A2Y32_03195 [Spirochaetes bacterium GWF1_60_12]
MKLQAIAFDIDGTLYPSAALFVRMLPGAIRRLRLLLAFDKIRKQIRQPGFYAERRIPIPAGVDAFHRMQSALTAERLGRKPELVHGHIESFFYGQQEEVFARIRLFPHVEACLESLRAAGYRLGALSDFPARRKLQLLKLDKYFDVIMTSEESGYVKPHRASFDQLAAQLGVPAGQTLYVGNSERYDVAGAQAAGMRTALISRRRRVESAADFVFRDYRQLTDFVARQAAAPRA